MLNANRVLAGLLLATFARGGLAQPDFLPDHALSSVDMQKFWQLQLPLEKGQLLQDVYKVEDQLYLSTQDGYVFAVHADTGVIRWLRQVTRSGYRLRPPAHSGERVVFVTPTHLLVLDKYTGEGLAERELEFPAGSGVACDGQRVYLGGINARFYAFDLDTLYESWKSTTGGPVLATPALYDPWVFFACDDGRIYSAVAENKLYHWVAATLGANSADVVTDRNGVYIASRDQSLYLFDLSFGRVRWRARFSGPLYEAPVVTPDVAYQYCPDDGLVAVNTAGFDADVRIRWRLAFGRKALTVHGDSVLVLTRTGDIAELRLDTGDVLNTISGAGLTLAIPSPHESALFLASPDGRVFCARPRGVPFARREDLRQALQGPTTQPASTMPSAGEAQTPTTMPAAGRDFLTSEQRGAPVGGKSKVSREFGGGRP